jgi:hypothetical protein
MGLAQHLQLVQDLHLLPLAERDHAEALARIPADVVQDEFRRPPGLNDVHPAPGPGWQGRWTDLQIIAYT